MDFKVGDKLLCINNDDSNGCWKLRRRINTVKVVGSNHIYFEDQVWGGHIPERFVKIENLTEIEKLIYNITQEEI